MYAVLHHLLAGLKTWQSVHWRTPIMPIILPLQYWKFQRRQLWQPGYFKELTTLLRQCIDPGPSGGPSCHHRRPINNHPFQIRITMCDESVQELKNQFLAIHQKTLQDAKNALKIMHIREYLSKMLMILFQKAIVAG